MWVVPAVDFANNASIRLGFIGDDCHRTMQTYTLSCLFQKGHSSFRIVSSPQAKVDHLTVHIDCALKTSPFAADTDVGLIDVPIYVGATQMLLCSLGQLRAELLNPAIHGRPTNGDAVFCEQIHNA